MRKTMVLTALAFPLGVLAACPGPKPPAPPAACTQITEDQAGADHCSKDKADCERTLSRIQHNAHQNRCPMPPCTAYAGRVECTGTGQECELADGSFGQIFETHEYVTCR